MSNLDIVPREESERRLAAILVADVVGYSRLIGWKAWQSRGAFTSPEKLTTKVRDRPFAFDDLGMKAVKNIARLVRVYRVRPGEVTAVSKAAAGPPAQRWRLTMAVSDPKIRAVFEPAAQRDAQTARPELAHMQVFRAQPLPDCA